MKFNMRVVFMLILILIGIFPIVPVLQMHTIALWVEEVFYLVYKVLGRCNSVLQSSFVTQQSQGTTGNLWPWDFKPKPLECIAP